jgi:hypothetical protein
MELLARYGTVAGGLVAIALAGWAARAEYRRLTRSRL